LSRKSNPSIASHATTATRNRFENVADRAGSVDGTVRIVGLGKSRQQCASSPPGKAYQPRFKRFGVGRGCSSARFWAVSRGPTVVKECDLALDGIPRIRARPSCRRPVAALGGHQAADGSAGELLNSVGIRGRVDCNQHHHVVPEHEDREPASGCTRGAVFNRPVTDTVY
jgi:hypothetical protein